MSTATKTFEQSIQDAENLLRHFDRLNTQPPPPENEVLKRAGLIMTMTAWETLSCAGMSFIAHAASVLVRRNRIR